MKVSLSAPDISQAEIDAVVSVLSGPNLSLGPKLGEFEGRWLSMLVASVQWRSTVGRVPYICACCLLGLVRGMR